MGFLWTPWPCFLPPLWPSHFLPSCAWVRGARANFGIAFAMADCTFCNTGYQSPIILLPPHPGRRIGLRTILVPQFIPYHDGPQGQKAHPEYLVDPGSLWEKIGLVGVINKTPKSPESTGGIDTLPPMLHGILNVDDGHYLPVPNIFLLMEVSVATVERCLFIIFKY